jgi:hypothetical protein
METVYQHSVFRVIRKNPRNQYVRVNPSRLKPLRKYFVIKFEKQTIRFKIIPTFVP